MPTDDTIRELRAQFDALPRPPWSEGAVCTDERCVHRYVEHSGDRADDFACLADGCQCAGWDPLTTRQWRIAFAGLEAGLASGDEFAD